MLRRRYYKESTHVQSLKVFVAQSLGCKRDDVEFFDHKVFVKGEETLIKYEPTDNGLGIYQ